MRVLSRLRLVEGVDAGEHLALEELEDAPPPVEMWDILSARPAFSTGATESPPPMMVMAPSVSSARVSATSKVPLAKASISNTPMGPFQMTDLHSLSSVWISLDGLGADVEAHPAVGDLVDAHGLGVGVRGELVGDDDVGGEEELHAGGLALAIELLGEVDLVVLDEGGADISCRAPCRR